MNKTKEEMTPVEKLWDEYSTRIPEDAYGGAEEIAEKVAGKEIMYESDFKSAFEQYSLQSTKEKEERVKELEGALNKIRLIVTTANYKPAWALRDSQHIANEVLNTKKLM